MRTVITHSPEETIELAARLSKDLKDNDFISLIGELGTGKTMFVKGLAKGLLVKDYIHVNSPSFVVLKEYHGRKDLYHFDVYRLDFEGFCQTVDYRKYFYNRGICVVEWADKIRDILPENYLEINIEHKGVTERQFSFRTIGDSVGKSYKL